jgi:hypothetical protein
VDETALLQVLALPAWHTDWHDSVAPQDVSFDDDPALASAADDVPQ